eukprot:TRINITY_DN7192_c0_g4_i1.p1 TRINITY_DN7192_c0_g4~~TRINITY_DN7192_c0_g4_i1.p1  ORF type:complete len:184 (+),score=86.67 TRINITY_DN7192_c0_g4_i1:82-633(+)
MSSKKKAPAKSKDEHPAFSDMIQEAIATLHERSGSSRAAITKVIFEKYPQLNNMALAQFRSLLNRALKRGVENEKLIQIKASYKLALKKKPSEAKEEKAEKKEAKKSTAKKAPASPSKKTTTKKSPAKKSTTKKSPAKKTTTKKSPSKKTTTKKSTVKKTTTKKSPAKKTAAKSPSKSKAKSR